MKKSKIPETSLEAYRSLDADNIRQTYSRILWALTQIGEGTYEDIAHALRLDGSKVWKRLSEMQRMDMIYRTENKKTLSSGRKGYTWKVTLKNTPTVQEYSRNISKISEEVKQYKPQTLF